MCVCVCVFVSVVGGGGEIPWDFPCDVLRSICCVLRSVAVHAVLDTSVDV